MAKNTIIHKMKSVGIKFISVQNCNANRDRLIKTDKGVFYCKFQRESRYTKPNGSDTHSRYLTMNLDLFRHYTKYNPFDFLCICMKEGQVYYIDRDTFGINSICEKTRTQEREEKILNCDIKHFTNLVNFNG